MIENLHEVRLRTASPCCGSSDLVHVECSLSLSASEIEPSNCEKHSELCTRALSIEANKNECPAKPRPVGKGEGAYSNTEYNHADLRTAFVKRSDCIARAGCLYLRKLGKRTA
eukprot:scpid75278/ scgid17373/ 